MSVVSVDYSMCGAIVGYQNDVRSRPLTVDGTFMFNKTAVMLQVFECTMRHA